MENASEVWQLVYTKLAKAGFSVYSPGQHTGECFEPYVVVTIGSALPYNNYTTIQTPYDILCYVPEKAFSTLEKFVASVEECLDECDFLRSAHYRTASYYDADVKGHMISTQYVNYRRM